MKKSMLFVVIAMLVSLFATPARASDPLSFVVIAGITVGVPAVVAAWKDGKISAPPPACETKLVKAATGNYYYQELDQQGDCTYTLKEF